MDAVHNDGAVELLHSSQLRLSRLALVLTGDAHVAEDLVQETMTRVVAKWSKVSRSDDPHAYAAQMLINLWRDAGRRNLLRKRETAETRASWLDESHESDVLDRVTLQQALDSLTARQRAVLYLRFYEDLAVRDVAARMGCSEGTVKSQTSYALGRLSDVLKRELGIRRPLR